MKSNMSQTFEMEFIESIKERDAWKKISASEYISWNDKLITKYAEQLDWNELSENSNINWSIDMLEKFKYKINWDKLTEAIFGSYNRVNNIDSLSLIKPFLHRWNWKELSQCRFHIPEEIIAEYAEYWDWKELINNCNINWTAEMFLQFRKYIPVSNLEDFTKSEVWDKMVKKKALVIVGKMMTE